MSNSFGSSGVRSAPRYPRLPLKLCPTMKPEDVTATLDLALKVSGLYTVISSLGFQPYLQQNVGAVLFCLVKVTPSEDESMAYRVLALTVAAGVSLCSVALAKEHCRGGQVYFRSKHTCVAKGVAVARGIYHAQHQVATKAHGTNIVNRRSRAGAASAAAPIPLPPV